MTSSDRISENLKNFSIFKNYADNKSILNALFEHPDVKDRKVVVLSIAGTKRKGKSFFLNYCLRFLYSHYSSVNFPSNSFSDSSKWIQSEFDGFSCTHSLNIVLQDVLIWNDVFLHTDERTGVKFAIVVLDTQGLSDSALQSENKQQVFNFLAEVSSIFVLNVFNEINENQLEKLSGAIEALQKDGKTLQNLMFLVRDWDNLHSFEYGIDNGHKYLSDLLTTNKTGNINHILQLVKESCNRLHCVLLPHPGKEVATNKSDKSTNFRILDEEFRDEIVQLIEYLLRPENLVPKKLNESELNGIELLTLIEQLACIQPDKTVEKERNDDVKSADPQQVASNYEDKQSYRKPVQVLSFTEDNKIKINDDCLKEIFNHSEVKDREIVVFTIIGAYRKGKSFFLNYCLRYLYAHYPSINCPNHLISSRNNWIGDEKEPLKGFSWRSGSARDTSGIVMWNDAFLYTNENCNKIAIVVVDTQGLFDSGTLPIDNSRIFTLGTLMSSMLVLNLSGVVQENQLEYLQYAIESAKFMSNESQEIEEKRFQKLVFLVRDWGNIDDFMFGIEGGNKYLEYFLKSKSDKKADFKNLCEVISDAFDDISCSLLPHPGNTVAVGKARGKKYEGNWAEMDEDFKEELTKLVEHLLNSASLIPRRINGTIVKGSDYLQYVLDCFELFQSDQLPQVKTIYDTTIDNELKTLVNSCLSDYKEIMKQKLKNVNNLTQLEDIHETTKQKIIKTFEDGKKMGNTELIEKFHNILKNLIDECYEDLKIKEEENIKIIEERKKQLQLEFEEKQKEEEAKMENIRQEIEEKQKMLSKSQQVQLAKESSKKKEETIASSSGAARKQFPQKQPVDFNQDQQQQSESAANKELNDLVDLCIKQYQDTIIEYQDKITSVETFEIYHKMSKLETLLKYEDSKRDGSPNQIKESKKILENKIDQFSDEFKIHLKQTIENERKFQQQLAEQKRHEEEQIKIDRKIAESLAEIEKMENKQEQECQNYLQQIHELKCQVEKERDAKIKAEQMRDQAKIEVVELKNKKSNRNHYVNKFFGSSSRGRRDGYESKAYFYMDVD